MARTITEIHNQILANMASNPVLGSVNNTSLTGRLRLFSYIIAVAIQLLEKIFDKIWDLNDEREFWKLVPKD